MTTDKIVRGELLPRSIAQPYAIAVLFDAHHPGFRDFWGDPIRNRIISTNVLQSSGRNMMIRGGYFWLAGRIPPTVDSSNLARRLFYSHPWQLLREGQVERIYLENRVYAWVINNVNRVTAERLHRALSLDDDYLGLHGLERNNVLQQSLYEYELTLLYRIKGRSFRLLYSLGWESENFQCELDECRRLGFEDVRFELKPMTNFYDHLSP